MNIFIFIFVIVVTSANGRAMRNVLLIISDDLRSFDENSFTPNIDELILKSLYFNNAYAQVRNINYLA